MSEKLLKVERFESFLLRIGHREIPDFSSNVTTMKTE